MSIQVPPSAEPAAKQLQPGCRADNAWLQYNYDSRPLTPAQWDEPRYVHKTNVGYYTWPRDLLVHGPASRQPRLDPAAPSPQEREIEEFFGDQANVDRLVSYLSLEGKKGRDKFNNGRLLLFKGLFRNHGPRHLAHFLPHLQRLVADKQESSQRCAAEIICGLIKGSKHWPYEAVEAMWADLLPVIRSALGNLTVETIGDWTICISNASKDRDPNRLHWLLECLMEESTLGDAEASFVECGRLMILQGALTLQSWRVAELLHRLLLRFETRLEESPFQNVRDRLASTLVSIFRANVKFAAANRVTNGHCYPESRDFVDKVLPRLQSLVEEDEASRALVPRVEAMKVDDDKEAVQPAPTR